MKDILSWVRPNIRALEPYSTARDEYDADACPGIFLDANESPYDNGVNRYPDPHQRLLKEKVAGIKGVRPAQLFIGNGSDEAIDLLLRIFCTPGRDNAVAIVPSYGMYAVAAATNDVALRPARLRADFTLDTESLLAATDAQTRLIFLCSPNNPSGNVFPAGQIRAILERFDGIVVVDEAYIDFSDTPSLAGELEAYPNLVVLQTFSKAWGLAGMRLGLALADPQVIALLDKVKYPYNINILAQEEALRRINPAEKDRHVAEIRAQRERLAAALPDCPGIRKVWPSEANFLLVETDDPDGTYQRLIRAGIIVRNRSRVPGCAGCLRITVGTPSQNDRLLAVLRDPAATPERASDGRQARIRRWTRETDITVELDLDHPGVEDISTGIGFFDHMLAQLPHHGGLSLRVRAVGDLQVDTHHTIEDVGIVLGEAILQALGDKAGIGRYGFALPMDDCDALVLMDLGGRIDFRWEVSFDREKIGDMPTEMFRHFFQSLSQGARCNLHIQARGINAHHKAEAIFKAFARTLRMAVARTAFPYELPTSKGLL